MGVIKKQLLQNQGSSKSSGFIPKGYLAIKVGLTIEEQERVVIPVVYFNHPLFMKLLKDAEDEYGFDQKGTITIPCRIQEFRYILGLIDQDKSSYDHHANHANNHHGNHHYRPIVGCFKA